MLVELGAFSDESFDPKAWVNRACAGRSPEEPTEKFLSEVEMKLQLLAGTALAVGPLDALTSWPAITCHVTLIHPIKVLGLP